MNTKQECFKLCKINKINQLTKAPGLWQKVPMPGNPETVLMWHTFIGAVRIERQRVSDIFEKQNKVAREKLKLIIERNTRKKKPIYSCYDGDEK